MKSSISGSDTPFFEAVTYARAWLTLGIKSINRNICFLQPTSIQPCLFSTLWKSWKTLSCTLVIRTVFAGAE